MAGNKYWDAWRNTRTVWQPLPISAGLVGLGVLSLITRGRRDKQAPPPLDANGLPAVQVEGSLWVHLYAALPLRTISRAWGWMNSLTVPTPMRSPLYRFYSWVFGCNLDEMADPDLSAYPNLGEFFYRSLKDGARTIAPPSQALLVSPADGRILHTGTVEPDGRIEQIKGLTYSVNALLGPSVLAKTGSVGAAVAPGNKLFFTVIYLAPGDYHRFHSPADWVVTRARHFAGELYSVSPFMARALNNLFVLNERVALLGQWAHGFFSYVPVGATNVGSIVVNMCPDLVTSLPEKQLALGVYERPITVPGTPAASKSIDAVSVRRGEEMGGFRLGSTVVLVFEAPETFSFAVEGGQKVKVGEPLGR
ncbi:phosphatidylserine decarboxylase-domain-containing protein [Entophlyctis helioformis]|nr:phosphatidylserine decarboxylase-domain-containing protein [Entophlyctis helioformis]